MDRLVAKGQEWLARAQTLEAQRAPLKKLRDLLHTGLRLGLELPAVEHLRRRIRAREWEDAAQKVRFGVIGWFLWIVVGFITLQSTEAAFGT